MRGRTLEVRWMSWWRTATTSRNVTACPTACPATWWRATGSCTSSPTTEAGWCTWGLASTATSSAPSEATWRWPAWDALPTPASRLTLFSIKLLEDFKTWVVCPRSSLKSQLLFISFQSKCPNVQDPIQMWLFTKLTFPFKAGRPSKKVTWRGNTSSEIFIFLHTWAKISLIMWFLTHLKWNNVYQNKNI